MNASPPYFDIDAYGSFPPGHVLVDYTQQARPTTPAIELMINEAWERTRVECSQRNAICYDGFLVRWISHGICDGKLHITAGPTGFKDCVGTNYYNGHRVSDIGYDHFSNPIGSTATVISSDGWLIYGRRSQRVVYHAGYLHTFGGALEKADLQPDGQIDVFAAITRELSEELSLEPHEIESMICLGIIHDREIWQPELLFDVHVRLDADTIKARLTGEQALEEHQAIETLLDTPDAVVPFIRQAVPIAPVCVGAICLHGLCRWGQEWYKETRKSLGI